MPVKVFGSPFLATHVQNNAADFGITEPVESSLLVWARGGEIGAGQYGDNWISTAQPTAERTWARGFYPSQSLLSPSGTSSTPECFQDGSRVTGAWTGIAGTEKWIQFGFPGLAGTDDFLPLQSKINYVRYWMLGRGAQYRKDAVGNSLRLDGSGGTACGGNCGDSECELVPRAEVSSNFGGVTGVAGVLFPHVVPIGNDNLPATAETTAIDAAQKAGVATYFRGIDRRDPDDLSRDVATPGFRLRYTPNGSNYSLYNECWVLNDQSKRPEVETGWEQNPDYVLRSELFTSNPFGSSSIPWTADYAQWCAFGVALGTGSSGNCHRVMVSDFAIEIGYDLQEWVVNSRCGEAQPLADGALVKGYYESADLPADWRFEYGANASSLTLSTPWNLFEVGPQEVFETISGLAPGVWYYRLHVRDALLQNYYGDVCSFETTSNCQVRSVLVM